MLTEYSTSFSKPLPF